MIPSEVIAIADLIVPDRGWRDTVVEDWTLKAAWRIYNAGYRVADDDGEARDER